MKTDAEDAGAGMIGTLEFNSALYYRYAALNIDLLADNLGNPDAEALKNIVTHFIKATLQAMPGARQNSMNANTRPSYVLGTVKLNGQPVQLVNAFENPVSSPGKGFIEPSIEKINEQHSTLAKTWGVTCDAETSIPQDDLATFISTLTNHVS
jgi:CRISPR system Cascade subunit CasC